MNHTLSRTALTLAGVGILGSLIVLLHPVHPSSDVDFSPRAIQALATLGKLTGYKLHVETTTTFPDKQLYIDGHYGYNHPSFSFAAESTTTITTRSDTVPRSFSLKHMIFSDDMYTSIASDDPLLARAVPVTDGWQHTQANAVPRHLQAIATHGPIVDPLLLFRTVGATLTPLVEPAERAFNGATTTMYTTSFTTHGTVPSALKTLQNRLGATGTIDIYLSKDESRVLGITFSGPEYRSTTTITSDVAPVMLPPTTP
jgi:hypothetical protein